ncbi:MAG: hypothetical protein O3C54_05700, partial [Proteobacteria bacterium]|nr:hypothetical protein [Pseudomonadota bacterium]
MNIDFKGINAKLPEVFKRKQKLIAVIVIGGMIILATTAILLTDEKDGSDNDKITKARKEIDVSQPLRKVRAEDRWLEKSENQLIEISKLLEQLRQGNAGIVKKVEDLEGNINQRIKVIEEKASPKEIRKHLNDLNNEKANNESANLPQPTANNVASEIGTASMQKEGNPLDNGYEAPSKIMSYDIGLEGGFASKVHGKDLDVYLPAGSYVDAIVIKGADASVGIESQSNPIPFEFRVTGKAVTALYKGKPQKVDIEGCTVTGSATGDLSSERGYIQLLTMTCSRSEGKVFEVDVKGSVTSKGKTGIRGTVVSREGDLITKSFLAGLVGGIGS